MLQSEHFQVYYYPEEDTLARTALGIAEDAYDRTSARFRHEVGHRIPLIIYSSHQDFEQTNVSPYFLPEGVAGFTEFLKGRVALPFNGSYHDFNHVIRHELVHVFQMSRMAESYRTHYRNLFVGPPLWFTEGMAEVWSGPWDSTGDLFLGDLVVNDMVPPISALWRYSGTFVIYKIGEDLVRFLEREYGPDVVPTIYDELWRSRSFEEALERVTGIPLDELSERWHYDLARRYFPKVETEKPLGLAAEPLAVDGPSFQAAVPPPGSPLDPDRYFFLSPRNGYMSIYRGSTRGREKDVDEVIQGQRKPEFESFHGFESRISVSREGILAFVSKYHERDGLFLYDLERKKLVGKWQFDGLISLRSPTFRPDGKAVALAGLSQAGRQDLYLFEFGTGTLRPLTADRYFEDDPAWSPDGKTLAFVSDRVPWGETGARNIFLLDLADGSLRPLTWGPWKDSAPAWSADGERLAYSSDRAGAPQIFVADSTRRSVRVTSVLGGAMSPVWTRGDRRLLFTGMGKQRFGIFSVPVGAEGDTLPPPRLPGPAALAMAGPPDSLVSAPPRLWPAWRWSVGTDSLSVRRLPYHSHFTLDLAQGGVAVEPSQGTGEGVQALLTDQLGNKLIFLQVANTAEQFSDVLGRFNLGVTYVNLQRRLNWGFNAFHFAGDFLDELGYTYFERRVGGTVIASYPYSKFFRVESSMGLLYSDRAADSFRPARKAVLGVNYLSLIHDNSLWLPTGPIDGSRYNLTLGINTNLERADVENVVLLADYRRYFRTGLRTAYAVRLQGRLSEGTLPQRFLLGGSWSFRGYPRRGLVGTRSFLVNQEWRFPLLEGAVLGLPMGNLGLPPVEGAVFLDAGQALEEHEPLDTVRGSFGLGFRTNLAGLIVLRLDVARLTDFKRVEPGTHWDFFIGYDY